MDLQYNLIDSVDDTIFNAEIGRHDFTDANKFTVAADDEVKRIERLLDAREGTLSTDNYYIEKTHCQCGRTLTFYDFVFTALVDAQHSKSFVLHTLVGTKKVINAPRFVRCSNCARLTDHKIMYGMPRSYLCPAPTLAPTVSPSPAPAPRP